MNVAQHHHAHHNYYNDLAHLMIDPIPETSQGVRSTSSNKASEKKNVTLKKSDIILPSPVYETTTTSKELKTGALVTPSNP
jgi:hypothetical protein